MLKKVGIIGAGTMGVEIAETLAEQGLEVILIDQTEEKLNDARLRLFTSQERKLARWTITEGEKKLVLSRIQFTLDWRKLSDVPLVIEAVTEDTIIKRDVFRRLSLETAPHVVLATNTSTLSITELAQATRRADKVIGLHFFEPVQQSKLIEVVRGYRTSEETVHFAFQFASRIGKEAVEVYESPGFISSRLMLVMINEAILLYMEGIANKEAIDKAMRLGYDLPRGPLEMADRFGLDAVLLALEGLFREYGETKFRPSPLLKKMVRSGLLGVKSGEGFFRYDVRGERVDE
ncbi:MAG: 3-hydroxybutyryl-CoA dehydrogenase [Candidatus Carbobacillus altaicus]|uniref:3-hydroxybutyryl-CoA dehydrogenase n=1 Tax=Candidatus Carbonibacillus altaicus TaxID=2163959 RepID=A0A2R6Y2M4_9BACL|nr:MAG: 3-hydroxybutyryl-CoA dehydrogenase [Candidatus Carbobacillus altaicus]